MAVGPQSSRGVAGCCPAAQVVWGGALEAAPRLAGRSFWATRRVAKSVLAPEESAGPRKTAQGLARVSAVSEASPWIAQIGCWFYCQAWPGREGSSSRAAAPGGPVDCVASGLWGRSPGTGGEQRHPVGESGRLSSTRRITLGPAGQR
ncbi:hypothetical protein NDU88_006840 [Pleurodeles waltl]|uniref:Uncharacterized protein n=1 Tax=Pleurodeles waltl TaxID=8319 RepID=A0AAV7N3K7_PLEWA|nr:hypothetical protein NDU88_006840 [Pleurodeles waltl]